METKQIVSEELHSILRTIVLEKWPDVDYDKLQFYRATNRIIVLPEVGPLGPFDRDDILRLRDAYCPGDGSLRWDTFKSITVETELIEDYSIAIGLVRLPYGNVLIIREVSEQEQLVYRREGLVIE